MSGNASPAVSSGAQSPKRKRSGSASGDSEPPQYDGADDTELQYAYDDENPSDAEQTLHSTETNGTSAKRRKIDRPTQLNYAPHMTLRGHKRGVAAVKFSPDGRLIASCCTYWSNLPTSKTANVFSQRRTVRSRSGTPTPEL